MLAYRSESVNVERIIQILQYLEESRETESGDGLCCRACGQAVVRHSEAIRMAGSHTHYCRNPEGETFHIGCFGEGEGLRAVGEPTSAWSWFSGYRWQVAVCAACGAQLGWLFSGERHFAGLILNRLVDCEPPSQPGAD